MITRSQIKFDVLGQTILIGAILLFYFFKSQMVWTNTMLVLLGIWQMASAFHLFLTYRYIQKVNFLKTSIVLVISLPIWMHFVGGWAYFAVGGVLLWYFFWSVRDMIVVYNRPRSFWDLCCLDVCDLIVFFGFLLFLSVGVFLGSFFSLFFESKSIENNF